MQILRAKNLWSKFRVMRKSIVNHELWCATLLNCASELTGPQCTLIASAWSRLAEKMASDQLRQSHVTMEPLMKNLVTRFVSDESARPPSNTA